MQDIYNESNRKNPPQLPNYYTEQNFDPSSFDPTNELDGTIEVPIEPHN